MTLRLYGLSDEERLAFEEANGIKTEGARLIIEESVKQAEELTAKLIREVQEVIGPHGTVTRLQAGGMQIGEGLSVFEDGVLKTTILHDGNLRVGSNIEDPAYTSFCVFVNEQTYNNEEMGAGDLLIGDNSEGVSNVKYDASEGQLQFRLGTDTINVYVDTDGALKAGGGAVLLNEDGITIIAEDGSLFKQYKFVDLNGVYYGGLSGQAPGTIYDIVLTSTGVPGGLPARLYMQSAAYNAKLSSLELRAMVNGESTFPYISLSKNGSGPDTVAIQGHVVINDTGGDYDTRIEGDTDANLLFVDASTDRVGIGTNAPDTKFHVNGTAKVGSLVWDGWEAVTETWTRTGDHTFTVSGDLTTRYSKGRRVKYNDGTTDYGVVGSSSHAGGTTTVNLIPNNDYAMAAATITGKYVSYIENPEGFPRSFNYTPTFANTTQGSGTITGKFYATATRIIGDVRFVLASDSAVSGGVSFTTPVAMIGEFGDVVGHAGFRDQSAGLSLDVIAQILTSTTIRFQTKRADTTFVQGLGVSSTSPFTWADTDFMTCRFDYAY